MLNFLSSACFRSSFPSSFPPVPASSLFPHVGLWIFCFCLLFHRSHRAHTSDPCSPLSPSLPPLLLPSSSSCNSTKLNFEKHARRSTLIYECDSMQGGEGGRFESRRPSG